MRHFTLFLILLSATSFASNNKGTESKIKAVTVYLSGAQIERTANIQLPIGTTEFTFDHLSPYIQESSIQVSGLKNATILSINFGINYLSKQDKSKGIDSIQKQILSLYDNIQAEDHLISGYNEELYLITQNRTLGTTNQIVNLEKLQKFAIYFRTRTTEIRSKIYDAEKVKHDLNATISDLKKQLLERNVDEKVQTGEIKIKLNTEVETNLNLALTYNVTNAGWFPMYDIKAEKINTPIQLAYKAHVYQNTGNQWDDVNITLSTSDPSTNNIKPDLNPKYLNFISTYSSYKSNRATKSYNYKYNPLVKTVSGVVSSSIDGLPLPGVSIIEKGTSNGTQTDFDGNYTLKTNGGQELVYSYVGTKSETLPIHSSIMNVSMDEDMSLLESVVITGYNGGTSENKTRSAVSTITIDELLQGQVAGIRVNNVSGQPGNSTNIVIRGRNSLNGDTEPLFIIDGIIVSQDNFRTLNQNDIKDISVVKDEEAMAMYGSRGAGGVILISTKESNVTSNGDIIEEGITNTRFEIATSYTVPSNGDVSVIEIENYTIPATYSYFAAPILNENVFLTADIENWEQYNLLPAEANVYFEGSYSGKTNINPQSTTEKLTISLGVDPNVVVKRTQPINFKKNAFLGSNKIRSKQYDIELKNNKSSAIDLVLLDRIPISQNKEIKIDEVETGNAAYDDKKGILKWKVKIPANDKSVYKFSYVIKYPKYKRVNL